MTRARHSFRVEEMRVRPADIKRLALLLAATLIVAACGSPNTVDSSPSPASPAAAASSTPRVVDPAAPCEQCWPLSGLPAANGAALDRKPLLIKIDNAPAARPHYSINQADMVLEIIVEGGVTRLAAGFHAQDPAQIGSGRSARRADRTLTQM